MKTQTILVLVVAVFGAATACRCGGCCGCQCGGGPIVLPQPNPYEALGVALSVPTPVPTAPYFPAYAPIGPIFPGCGPPPSPITVQQVPSVTIPGPASPIISLPTPCLPPPQIIAHKCVVSKCVQKPQVFQRLINVPSVARFLKKAVGNVVENIPYTATPRLCAEGPVPIVPVASPCYGRSPCGPCGCC